MHAEEARHDVTDVARAGAIESFALRATYLSCWTVVGVVALNEKAAARAAFGGIDAAEPGALTAASRREAFTRAAADVHTGGRNVDERIAGDRSVGSRLGDDDRWRARVDAGIEIELAVAARRENREEASRACAAIHQRVPATVSSASARANPLG